ncbi:MAG: Fe-S protein assembly co-chaperone HscB [Candidatus Rokuibacteriota bacterium]
MMDNFEVFGLPRRLGIDAEALQGRFYELSRRLHPDFHTGAPPEEQARTLEASASLNAAYRALRDPIARIEYLVQLEDGRATREGAAVKPPVPPGLLEEMFEIQEALAEARAGALDETARKTLSAQRERLLAQRRDAGARLTGPLSAAWDAAEASTRPALLEQFRQGLATRAYLKTVIDDLDNALGQDKNA